VHGLVPPLADCFNPRPKTGPAALVAPGLRQVHGQLGLTGAARPVRGRPGRRGEAVALYPLGYCTSR
jgi:hypothetical protein